MLHQYTSQTTTATHLDAKDHCCRPCPLHRRAGGGPKTAAFDVSPGFLVASQTADLVPYKLHGTVTYLDTRSARPRVCAMASPCSWLWRMLL